MVLESLTPVLEWLGRYWAVLLFYITIGVIVYYNREKFEFEGKFIALYKTKFGIEMMKKFIKPVSHKRQLIGKYLFWISLPLLILSSIALGILSFYYIYLYYVLAFIIFSLSSLTLIATVIWFGQLERAGTLGIYVGFIGMALILIMVAYGVYQLIFEPTAPPMFTPVLPGFQIPGGPTIPLIQGLLALFVVVVIHEFAHGVISKLYKIRIKSSGFAMIGPLPAAFVEPDDKKLEKAPAKHQLSMYAAGPFSNVLLGLFLVIIINLIGLLSLSIYAPGGISVVDSDNSMPEGLEEGMIIDYFNGEEVRTLNELQTAVGNRSPGETITLRTNEGDRELTLQEHPDNNGTGYMGLYLDQHVRGNNSFIDFISPAYFWLFGNPYGTTLDTQLGLLGWIFLLTIGIGLVNLLPLGPVDGGRMILLKLQQHFSDNTAKKIWGTLSYVLLALIILLIFVPIIRALI